MPLYKNKSSSTMLRKKMKSWNGFPYEKQNLTVRGKSTGEIKKTGRQERQLKLKHIQHEQMLKYEFHNISCLNAEKNKSEKSGLQYYQLY